MISDKCLKCPAFLDIDFSLFRPALSICFSDESFGDALIGFANSSLPVSVTSFAKCCHVFRSSVGQNWALAYFVFLILLYRLAFTSPPPKYRSYRHFFQVT
jgi:hypothetical protein